MSSWVDYRSLREQIAFEEVLQHFKIPFKRRGSQAVASCPLPNHPKQEGKTSQPFSVSLDKRVFQCFGCGAKGNVLDFICLMRGLNPRQSMEFRRAALFAQETFLPDRRANPRDRQVTPPSSPPSVQPRKSPQEVVHITSAPAVAHGQEIVNEPLDFELKNLDPKPQYLLRRGFTERTIAHFGLGYCTKGTFAGRVVIPLRDHQGRLIGYAGRLVFDDAVDEENPKYLFPGRREREGRVLQFAKSLFVYNGHAIRNPVQDLVVVQGFPAAWWLWQNGHPQVVALMGDTCSVDQAKLIVSLVSTTGRIWLLTDGTKVGERCTADLLFDLSSHRFCKWVKLRDGQPTDYDAAALDRMLEWNIKA